LLGEYSGVTIRGSRQWTTYLQASYKNSWSLSFFILQSFERALANTTEMDAFFTLFAAEPADDVDIDLPVGANGGGSGNNYYCTIA
jgi:hypothetical protein